MYLCTALQEARPSWLAARISPITDVLSLITKPAPHRGSPQHHREGRWVVGGGGGRGSGLDDSRSSIRGILFNISR